MGEKTDTLLDKKKRTELYMHYPKVSEKRKTNVLGFRRNSQKLAAASRREIGILYRHKPPGRGSTNTLETYIQKYALSRAGGGRWGDISLGPNRRGITFRPPAITFVPSQTMATTGPEHM